MPAKHGKTLRQLDVEAERYCKFYFDPAQQRQWREELGVVGTSYTVVVVNRFVPLSSIPESVDFLRQYGRGAVLDDAKIRLLQDYWNVLDDAVNRLHALIIEGHSIVNIMPKSESLRSWPAVGVATSENTLRALLRLQFEQIRQHRIPWDKADSSTYPTAISNGMYLLLDWARHG